MAQMPKYTQKDVSDVADAVMKNPGVPMDSSNFPDGMTDDVIKEITAREQHHQDVQAAMDKMKPHDVQAAMSQHSAVDDQGKDMDPDHSAPMAGLLGASDALTLGHTDELAGLIGAIDGNGYAPVRDAVREKQHFAREHHPLMYHGFGLAGGLQLPAPKGSGAALGTVAGEGYSDKSLMPSGPSGDSAGSDALFGGMFGGAAELAGNAIGTGVKRVTSKLAEKMAGDFWDPVLMRALFPSKGGSDALTELASNDAMAGNPGFTDVGPGTSEVADAVRANSKFPYLSPQTAKNSINGIPNAPAEGSIVNVPRGAPGNPLEPAPPWQASGPIEATMHPNASNMPVRGQGWTPQPGAPKEIQGLGHDWLDASSGDLQSIAPAGPAATARPPLPPNMSSPEQVSMQSYSPPSEVPPISPAERVASHGLGNMADAPSNGMDPSTLQGGIGRMLQKNIVGPTAIGIPKAGQAMLKYLDSNPGDYGLKAASLKGIINHVMSSTDPSFSDYLAKETFPEYLALSNKVDSKTQKDDNGK